MSIPNSPSLPMARVPPELVTRQLETILSGETFRNSSRLARFLRYIVEQSLEDNATVRERKIGVEVFDREEGYDTRADPVVRVEARQLRFKLAEYYAKEGAADEIVIHLPKGGYAAYFERRSVAAGLRQPDTEPIEIGSAAADPRGSKSPHTQRWLYVAAFALCAAGAALGLRILHHIRAAQPDNPASVAILPFTNLTADPANQYFADGLTDEITDSLARFKTLRVIARSSAFQFKGKAVDIHEVGRLLHVANVLEGSVERSGDRIRVIAHLERVSDGSQVWSNTYERRTSDLFAVQSELAAGIAESLKASGGVSATTRIPKPEAHELAIKARYDMQQVTADSLLRAQREYQQAIDVDPEYAAAYLGLASAKYDQFGARGSAYQTEGERKSAEQLFRKALELDPDLSAAHAMLAALAMQYDWNWAGAEREFQLAVAGPPSATAESFYAFFLLFRGRFAEADQHLRRMLDLDPFSTATMNNLVVARNLEGRFAEARENAQRMAAQYPKMLEPQLMIGMAHIGEGHPELALPIFEQLKQRFPQAPLFEAMARARAGQREEVLKLIRPFEGKYRSSGASLQWFALVYAFLGDESNTVKWLERSADLREWQVLTIAVNPIYAPMRSSPGFRALEKRMGLEQ